MIMQLVASGRGVAALPNRALTEYLTQGLVSSCRLGRGGVWRTLHAAMRVEDTESPYVQEFLNMARTGCFRTLAGIRAPQATG